MKPLASAVRSPSRPSEGANAARLLPPGSTPSSPARCCARVQPSDVLYISGVLYTRTHARVRLSFAISIRTHEIYLASGECPSAIRHNISQEYQPPSRALWNIYGGNMAAGVCSSVYGERPKVQRRLPARRSSGSHLWPLQRVRNASPMSEWK